MKSVTGRWVSGDDFFDRKAELEILERQVRGGNHILLTRFRDHHIPLVNRRQATDE